MKNIQKNKKSWIKGFVVVAIFAISVLNLSVEFQRDAKGDLDLNLTSMKAMADDEEGGSGCDQCKVDDGKKFSCKTVPSKSCSITYWGHTLSCSNAEECK